MKLRQVKYLVGLLLLTACTQKTELIYIEGKEIEGTKNAIQEILICNPPKGMDWVIWGQFQTACEIPSYALDDSEADFTNQDALCYRITPRKEADTLRLRIIDKVLNNHSRAPLGFYLQQPGKEPVELSITYRFLPVTPEPPSTYCKAELAVTDIVPQLKRVEPMDGETKMGEVHTVFVKDQKPSWYRITVKDSVLVEAADEDGAYYAKITLDKMRSNVGSDVLPNMVVED